jgi:multidrug efflux pump subunit AcrA (membrane-fusion protein)
LKEVFRIMMSSRLPSMKPIAFPLLAAVAGTLLFLLGTVSGRSADQPDAVATPQHETMHEHAKKHQDPSYVCPMHPQVVSSEPGNCPICGMKLVAKAAEASQATALIDATVEPAPVVTVSAVVVNQLGVRTAEVRRGTLTRHLEGSGVVLRSTPQGARPTTRNLALHGNDKGNSVSQLLVLGQVFEREAPLVYQGQKARVSIPGLGAREWTGTVSSLETQVSQTTHTFQFRVLVDNEGASVPGGMTAVVRLESEPVVDALLVPREAVIVTGKGARVIVALDGGRFQQRKVDAEDLGEDEILIRSGLREGERVVVSAQFLLDSEANLQAGLMRLTNQQARSEDAIEETAQ